MSVRWRGVCRAAIVGVALALILLVLGPVRAADIDITPYRVRSDESWVPLRTGRNADGLLTLDLSVPDFMELQRLDDHGRRVRLGLRAGCTPGLTAMARSPAASNRLLVLVSCPSSAPR